MFQNNKLRQFRAYKSISHYSPIWMDYNNCYWILISIQIFDWISLIVNFITKNWSMSNNGPLMLKMFNNGMIWQILTWWVMKLILSQIDRSNSNNPTMNPIKIDSNFYYFWLTADFWSYCLSLKIISTFDITNFNDNYGA